MSDEHEMTSPYDTEEVLAEDKGKGKAAAQDFPEAHVDDDDEDDDDDDDDEEGDEENEAEQVEDDGLEEIKLENVIGRRTRGVAADYAKAAEELGPEEDDEEDDDDFEPNEDTEMAD